MMSTSVHKTKRTIHDSGLPPEIPNHNGWKVICTAVLSGLLEPSELELTLERVGLLGIPAAKQDEIRAAVLRSNEKATNEQSLIQRVNLRIFQSVLFQVAQDENEPLEATLPNQPIGWGLFLISNIEESNDSQDGSMNQTIEVFLYPEGV